MSESATQLIHVRISNRDTSTIRYIYNKTMHCKDPYQPLESASDTRKFPPMTGDQ